MKSKHYTKSEMRNLQKRIDSGEISEANPISHAEFLLINSFTLALIDNLQTIKPENQYCEYCDEPFTTIKLEHIADKIAQGENLEAMQDLHEAFPKIIRQPSAILDLLKCHNKKTFQENIKA